jgi:hypothetical protein
MLGCPHRAEYVLPETFLHVATGCTFQAPLCE